MLAFQVARYANTKDNKRHEKVAVTSRTQGKHNYSMTQRFLPLAFLLTLESTEGVSELVREWLLAPLSYRYKGVVAKVEVVDCSRV
jgi:hypothetical protein